MSMEHKAYLFDYDNFQIEFYRILVESLLKDNPIRIIEFIEANLKEIKEPHEGFSLDNTWKSLIEVGDIQEYGDFALTKFYDPDEDIGLSYEWQEIKTILKEEFIIDSNKILLGDAISVNNKYFDPGRMGSYFQSLADVKENLVNIYKYLSLNPDRSNEMKDLIIMFERAIEANRGLYITF